LHLLACIPVGETGTNVTTVTFGHRSGKLLATGSEDNTIHIYVIGQMTSLLVRFVVFSWQFIRFHIFLDITMSNKCYNSIKIFQ
jgi:WD40 repeat protein